MLLQSAFRSILISLSTCMCYQVMGSNNQVEQSTCLSVGQPFNLRRFISLGPRDYLASKHLDLNLNPPTRSGSSSYLPTSLGTLWPISLVDASFKSIYKGKSFTKNLRNCSKSNDIKRRSLETSHSAKEGVHRTKIITKLLHTTTQSSQDQPQISSRSRLQVLSQCKRDLR